MAIVQHSSKEFEEAYYRRHIFLYHIFDSISGDILNSQSNKMST